MVNQWIEAVHEMLRILFPTGMPRMTISMVSLGENSLNWNCGFEDTQYIIEKRNNTNSESLMFQFIHFIHTSNSLCLTLLNLQSFLIIWPKSTAFENVVIQYNAILLTNKLQASKHKTNFFIFLKKKYFLSVLFYLCGVYFIETHTF